ERRIPQCPSAERRVPQCIISPPCQGSCNRRYPYACHAPKGLGRGAPEEKGYATNLSMLWFRWSISIISLGDPPGVTKGALPSVLNIPTG
ncbi:MAG: hypothetical protein ACKPKO_65760, partial [Candidatus Fonsibacter sp.]